MNVEFYIKVNNRNDHKSGDIDRLFKWATTNEPLKETTNSYRKWLLDNPAAARKEIQDKKLKLFSGVQFAGTFGNSGKSIDIKDMSGLMCLDFDHLNTAQYLDILSKDKYTYIMFLSPSADGIKVIIKHNIIDPDKWVYIFYELQQYYKDNYNLDIDDNTKDINRMCYIPFIENLLKNNDAAVYEYCGIYEKKVSELKTYKQTDITDELVKECFYLGKFISEHNILMCDDYQYWMQYGFSLCSLGEQGRMIFHHISCTSNKYDADECDEFYDKLLGTFNPEKTSIDYFRYNVKNGIADYVLYKTYNYKNNNKPN